MQNAFSILIVLSGKPRKTCDGRLSRFAARENLLTQCIITSLIPTATYCTSCQNEFKEVEDIYKEFIEGSDSANAKKCKDVYKDDLHLINYMFNYSQQLWKEMACSECLVNQNETKFFLKDCEDFHFCVDKEKNDSCTKCNEIYNKIMAAYDNIKGENPKRICFQIMENVHHIKTIWAKNLGCNKKHKSSLVLFTAMSSALMVLPSLFYGGLYIYKHADGDNEDETESDTQIGSNSLENGKSSDQVPPSNVPGTSKSNSKDDKQYDEKIDPFSDISTDSGEELILGLNREKQNLKIPLKEDLIPTRLIKLDSSDDERVIPTLTTNGSGKLLLEI